MEYEKLKELILTESFTDKQFTELKTICDIRLGNFSARAGVVKEMEVSISDTYPRLFHEMLSNALRVECSLAISPYHKLKPLLPKIHRQLVSCATDLFAMSEKWNPNKKNTRRFAIGIFHLYSDLVINYLRDCRVPVSLKTSLQHAEKFTGMVDKAFPNYIESGAIRMVILRAKS